MKNVVIHNYKQEEYDRFELHGEFLLVLFHDEGMKQLMNGMLMPAKSWMPTYTIHGLPDTYLDLLRAKLISNIENWTAEKIIKELGDFLVESATPPRSTRQDVDPMMN